MCYFQEQVKLPICHDIAAPSTNDFILQQVHYLMCLAANYAHIKDQEKFMDLQEIQFLHESEMSTLPKDRF